MIELLTKLPKYYVGAKTLPLSYTLSLTYRCNSRCKTCRIYERDSSNDLTTEEWTKIFEGLGRSPYWITFSGGEPFLREDLIELHDSLCKLCRPAIVNIPTNGLLTERIVDWVWEMCMRYQDIKLVVNVSIDSHTSELNDEIRGVKGALEKSTNTLRQLKALRLGNLTVGIHTVISTFNVEDFSAVCDGLIALEPDQYITEIAEHRNELRTYNLDITPHWQEYEVAISHLLQRTNSARGLPGITQAFRSQYYKSVVRIQKEQKQIIPCQAGKLSCHITPDGDVTFCCIKYISIGNLRDVNYDLNELWYNEDAKVLRKSISEKKCYCPMANVSYTNMLMHPPTLAKVVRRLI